jgi:hypothetical protein
MHGHTPIKRVMGFDWNPIGQTLKLVFDYSSFDSFGILRSSIDDLLIFLAGNYNSPTCILYPVFVI